MNKLCRLVGMILLFLLLANGFFGEHTYAVPGEREPSAVEGPAFLGARAPLASFAPPWYQEHISHSNLRSNTTRPILEPDLQRALLDTNPDDVVAVIAYVEPQLDVGRLSSSGTEAVRTGEELVSALKATASESQASLLRYLEGEQAAGRVSSYRSLWLLNALAVRGTPSAVRSLAAQPSVSSVRLDHWRQWVTAEQPASPATGAGGDHGLDGIPSAESQARTPLDDEPVEWNISRVRADDVWHTLQISGTGAVVAGMDTGVDWLHPALRSNYRGYNPHGPAEHRHNWLDATEGGAQYPVDGHGHGSHTLGTAVGQGGIGVAPGARWIGVRVLNNRGAGYDSWIHTGFQWLLAPGGDPAQAPDVVNCSWGNDNAYLTTFQDDLRALRAAGIFAALSAGNDGPGGGSVGSPASLPEAFAVGAVDQYDEIATFSGRGPSPWGELRPHVAAPGVHVRSSTPGGAYASLDGTSMAAPHVSGLVAMLRSVSPTLSITRTAYVVTSTAVPLSSRIPNNDTGWGRVDAFGAVASLAQSGFVTGTVREAAGSGSRNADPIPGAKVAATLHGGGAGATVGVAADSTYELVLKPGVYDMTASAFGYEPSTVWRVPVLEDVTTVRNFALSRKPTGSLRVRVTDAGTDQPITATIAVSGTPYTLIADTQTFDLPAGAYTVTARRLGYRVVTAFVTIAVDQTTTLDLALPRAPSILLVDSGGWYYESQVTYFLQALDDLLYAYDVWAVRHLPDDVPLGSDLAPYDIVVWSAPRDAPGYIGAGAAIAEYLDAGGRLFLSGQDVGFWDGGGTGYAWSPYYRDYLKARFVDDDAPTRTLVGHRGDILSGQTITIAGPGGADNQDYPDVVAIADSDAAAPVLRYQDDGCGGVRVGTCLGYRAIYLPFGFEGITERLARKEVMGRSLDWLVAAPPDAGLELQPQSRLGIGPPGSRVTHTVRLRHVGQSGGEDRVGLTLEGASWPTELSERSPVLSPCAATMLTISVTIPSTSTWDLQDVVTLTAQSGLSPTVRVSATLETKTPASVLLVDDDRWYDQQETYRGAMEGAGLAYDVWETSTPEGGHRPGPEEDTLQRYPVVVWWTGYDWYAPVTRDEIASLESYLDTGGRLLLSSQDFLYYHHDDPFSRRYLGVLTYTEDITPTLVEGIRENPVGSGLGPWPLTYPRGYQNWSDGLTPAADVGVAFRDQDQRGTALTYRAGEGATLFLAFPFEALPSDQRAAAMERSVGWLSWLGRSAFDVEPRSANPGDVVTYTLSLANDGPQELTAWVTNTLPAELGLQPEAFSPPGLYDLHSDQLSWRTSVHPDEMVTYSYTATVSNSLVAGDAIVNPARLLLEEHGIGFGRDARLQISAPDLSPSTFACLPWAVRPRQTSTCTLVLRNAGPGHAQLAIARIYPPGTFDPAEDPVSTSHGVVEQTGNSLTWSGPLMAGGTATLTFQLMAPSIAVQETRYGVTFLHVDAGNDWERPVWLRIQPWPVYLPLIRRLD